MGDLSSVLCRHSDALEIVTPRTAAPVQGGGNDEKKPNLQDKLSHRCTIVSLILNLKKKVISSISTKIFNTRIFWKPSNCKRPTWGLEELRPFLFAEILEGIHFPIGQNTNDVILGECMLLCVPAISTQPRPQIEKPHPLAGTFPRKH